MIRRFAFWFGLACALGLLLFCYRPVLFSGGQFGYRDAAHYYYPLYEKVQSEWRAGRVPLWDPSENAGMPLLGNPTAAVLYPGKLIFAALSYPWAVRIYAVAHTALACAGAWVLLRGWHASATGATLAGLSYAFGAPVLFQYCNIIFLVGAAWIPWGFWAVDRWLRLRRPGGLLALAVVLALQVLGGDPESAYVIGLSSGGYALLLARDSSRRRDEANSRSRLAAWAALIGAVLAVWVGLTLASARWLPGFRAIPGEGPWGPVGRWLSTGRLPRFRLDLFDGPIPGLPWVAALPQVVALVWGGIGLIWLLRWRRLGSGRVPIVPMLVGLLGAASLAGALAAAQLLPVAEYTGISARATDEGPHDIFPFSLEPYRLVELVWPGFFGRSFGSSVAWMGIVLPKLNHRVWVPSLYLGGLTMVFALAHLGQRGRGRGDGDEGDRAPWIRWMVAIAVVGMIASFGEFASPIWLARFAPTLAESIGPHDPLNPNSVRLDGFLRDGDGSPYALMAALLPGFHSFRFPSTLFTFVALALAALGGLGWDRIGAGEAKWARLAALLGTGAGLVGCGAVLLLRAPLVAWFEAKAVITLFGPLDVPAAVADIATATGQGVLLGAAAVALIALARRRPDLAGPAAVLVMTLDLGWANASIVRAVPQSDFEVTPSVLARIAEAEQLDPAPGPYRIHRMPIWNPHAWSEGGSADRVRDFVRWEHDTIQPKYGMLHGVEYTQTLGVAELYDYEWFFSPFPRSVVADAARFLKINPGDKVVVYPRRGFDLWNSRYFILPGATRWDDPDRGIASFLPDTSLIYPRPDLFQGPDADRVRERWAREEDVQILRNKNAFPRAWVVHDVRFKPPVVGLGRKDRKETMEELLFADDLFWRDPSRAIHDPRRLAWIETDEPASLAGYIPRGNPTRNETVTVREHASDRVVLDVQLDRPGLVVLADVFYPGWTLTIDGQPAPIYRANRLMRAAAVRSGAHTLVYTYRPESFRIGAAISLAALVVLGGSTIWLARTRGASPMAT